MLRSRFESHLTDSDDAFAQFFFAKNTRDAKQSFVYHVVRSGVDLPVMKGAIFKNSMLDYAKVVLTKISFSKKLFIKEYRKSFLYLDPEEQEKLREWVRNQVGKDSVSVE